MTCYGVNVGHFPTLDEISAKRLIVSSMDVTGDYSVRWMNWIQAYQKKRSYLLPYQQRPFYCGEPWDQFAGVPLANIVDIAIEVRSKVNYINLPYALDDQGFADAAKQLSRLAGTVYVALGVEMWNTGGGYAAQAKFNAKVAMQHGVRERSEFWLGIAGAVIRTEQMAQHLKWIPNVKIVFETQNTQPMIARRALEDYSGNRHIDALAVAPYFMRVDSPKDGPDKLYEIGKADLYGQVERGLERNVAVAREHSKQAIAYEIGNHVRGESAAVEQLIEDGRMLDLYQHAKRLTSYYDMEHVWWYRLYHSRSASEHWRFAEVGSDSITKNNLWAVLNRLD